MECICHYVCIYTVNKLMQASADQYVRITELCKVSQKSTTQNLIIYIVLPGQPSLLLIQVFRKKHHKYSC